MIRRSGIHTSTIAALVARVAFIEACTAIEWVRFVGNVGVDTYGSATFEVVWTSIGTFTAVLWISLVCGQWIYAIAFAAFKSSGANVATRATVVFVRLE